MARDYERLCDNILRSECFQGLEKKARDLKILVSDLNVGTQYNYLVTFKKYVEYCRLKGVEEPLKFDLLHVKEFLQQYKATTRGGYAFRLRKIFQLNGELAEFKVKTADNELPETLTQDEVNRLVKVTASLKWRAIIRLTYEAAMRSHEMTRMRVKHVKFDKFGAEVYVPSTKSQPLWLRVIDSVPLLQAWLEQHPNRDNREAYLFPGRNEGEQLSHAAFYLHLRAVSLHAHVKKKVSPHILRHSRLKWLKKYGSKYGISDSIICEAYGRWSPKNAHKMLDRYGRIDPHDANEIILKAHGKLRKEDVIAESLTEPQSCPRCGGDSDALSKYCHVCGMVLDEKEALRLMEEDEGVRRELGELRRRQAVFEHPLMVEWFEEKLRELEKQK